VDLSALLASFGGRTDLVKGVVDVFLEDAPAMLTRLKDAVRAGDAATIATTAHAIKGSAGLFSQGAVYERSRELERRARARDVGDAAHASAEIESSLSELMNELRSLRQAL
jgi:HPt (histidine-containing phosphotransfer) domain-containing protein